MRRRRLKKAVDELDGIPAWLNLFGLKALKRKTLEKSTAKQILNQMVKDPLVVSLVLQEYEKLGKNSKAVLKTLGKNWWFDQRHISFKV